MTSPIATKANNIADSIEIKYSNQPVPYPEAIEYMEQRVARIISGEAQEQLWFLEHPPLYTAGTSAKANDLLGQYDFPVYETGRGGQYTYHGAGQRIVYVMLDLKKRFAHLGYQEPDLRKFVALLEEWIIRSLAHFNIIGKIRPNRVGVWVEHNKLAGGEGKIAALGIRVKRWVSFHGIAINIEPELEHFSGIVPCGVKQYGVTSFADLGYIIDMAEVDLWLKHYFKEIFESELPR